MNTYNVGNCFVWDSISQPQADGCSTVEESSVIKPPRIIIQKNESTASEIFHSISLSGPSGMHEKNILSYSSYFPTVGIIDHKNPCCEISLKGSWAVQKDVASSLENDVTID
jgi:hypothetical protein